MSKGSLGKLGLSKRALKSLVARNEPDLGIGRRAFLIGAATTLVAKSTVARAADALIRPTFRLRKGPAGNLESVTLIGSSGNKWVIDTAAFDGNPKLTVIDSGTGGTIRLSDAVLPGTSFNINFEATIVDHLLTRKLRIEFTNTGVLGSTFTCEADLDKWIEGSASASAKLSQSDLQRILGGKPVAQHVSLDAQSKGTVAFTSDGSFLFDAKVDIDSPKVKGQLESLSLVGGVRQEPSILNGKRARYTRLSAVSTDEFQHDMDARTAAGWQVSGSHTGQCQLDYELHPDGTCASVISGGTAAFLAKAHDKVDLCLNNAHSVIVTNCSSASQGVVANLHDRGNWIDFPGVGVELGPTSERDSFMLLEGDTADYSDVELSARRYALHLDDAIVSTADTEPVALSLAVAQTRTVDPDKLKLQPLNQIKIQPSRMIGTFNLPTRIDVVRREDMLALSFEFINMRLETDGSRVVKGDASKPSYMIVTFPPQSIAEKTYREDDTGGPQPSDLPPVPSRVSGHSRLVFYIPSTVPYILFSLKGEDGKGTKGLLDWDRLTPNVVRTAFSSFSGSGPIRIDSKFENPADKIRITTRTIDKIEDKKEDTPPPGRTRIRTNILGGQRRGQTERKNDTVAPPRSISAIEDSLPKIGRQVNPAHIAINIPHERIPVIGNPLYTAIELPVRLILSPNESQVWAHTAELAKSPTTQRVELWHTRLARRSKSGQIVEGGRLPIRAVDAVDYEKNMGELFGKDEFDQAMMRTDRIGIVNNMVYRSDKDDTPPFWAERLMLTSLGGYLKGHGSWEWCYIPNRHPSDIISWTHNATLGRDHYVKIVRRGYLFPTGHPAAQVLISERKIAQTSSGPVAYLRKRTFVIVRQPTITFNEDEQRQLGLKSITVLTKETPPLSPDKDVPVTSGVGMWTLISSGPFPMQMQAEDTDGHIIKWGMPLIYVDQANAKNLQWVNNTLIPYYEKAAKSGDDSKHPRRHKLFGQKVSLAPAGDNSESTAYPTEELFFTAVVKRVPTDADQPAYRCILKCAKVRVAAADYLAGSAAPGPIEVEIPDTYKTSGFGNANVAKVFLKITENMPPGGIPLKFGDASKSGGLVNPDSFITAFAKGRGPVGGKFDQIQTGSIDPKDYLPDAAKLFGVVSLWELLPPSIPITPGDPKDPNTLKSPRLELVFEKDADQKPKKAIVQFTWKPEVNSWPSTNPILKINRTWTTSYAPLDLKGNVTTDLVDPSNSSYEFVGVLKDFDIDCIAPSSFILLHFDELRFTAKSGQGAVVTMVPSFPKTIFTGPLTFVQALQDLISSVIGTEMLEANAAGGGGLARYEGFDFTPFMHANSQGIQVGFHLGLPNLAFGAFTIENIALLAQLDLPFLGSSMMVTFAFCERSSPFRLSVMGFAGGGFLSITLSPSGIEILEAAFEFGGNLSLDIGVASGGVSLMAGIYFKMQGDKCHLEGYIRLNGRVSVLGIVRISVEFYLSLSYDTDSGCAYGTARVTVEIEVLFFSASVSMTVQKQIKGGGSAEMLEASLGGALPASSGTRFTDSMTEYDWTRSYCGAFA